MRDDGSVTTYSLDGQPKTGAKPKSSPRGKKAKPDGDICDSQTEIAAKMMLHYRNADGTSKLKIKIKKGTVCDWIAGKRLHGKPRPPEPVEGGRRRWSLTAWLAWFDANMWHRFRAATSAANGSTQSQMPVEELEETVEREQLELDRERIARERGDYIAMDLLERIAGSFSRQYHDQWKNRNEKTMIEAIVAKLQSLGIEPEKVADVEQFIIMEHQKFTDAVERSVEKFSSKLTEKLKASDLKQE